MTKPALCPLVFICKNPCISDGKEHKPHQLQILKVVRPLISVTVHLICYSNYSAYDTYSGDLGGKVGARSQTFCFCPFTALVTLVQK